MHNRYCALRRVLSRRSLRTAVPPRRWIVLARYPKRAKTENLGERMTSFPLRHSTRAGLKRRFNSGHKQPSAIFTLWRFVEPSSQLSFQALHSSPAKASQWLYCFGLS